MTMPHLMNCAHRPDDWCLDCVVELGNERLALKQQLHALIELFPWSSANTISLDLRDEVVKAQRLLSSIDGG